MKALGRKGSNLLSLSVEVHAAAGEFRRLAADARDHELVESDAGALAGCVAPLIVGVDIDTSMTANLVSMFPQRAWVLPALPRSGAGARLQ